MKKIFLLTMLGVSLPVLTMAQDDDLYFVPSKETKAKAANTYGMPTDTYYCGSKRSARDYNRRSWDATAAASDTTANDIIDFSAVQGVYPDSTTATAATEEDSDYTCTRKMSRFDGYTPSEAYWEGYRDGTWTGGRPGWYSAWYGSWYGPWYSTWFDPWYDSWYFGTYWGWGAPYFYAWYSPWRYDYYYWSRPHWGWHGGYYAGSGTRYWSRAGYSHHKYLTARGGDGARRGGTLAGYRVPRTTAQTYGTRGTRSNAGDLGGYRSRTYNNNNNFNNNNFSSGSRFFNRSSSGGGFRPSGGFGGGRSVGGGHSYGGRR